MRTLLTLATALALASPARADELTAEKRAAIVRLMDLTGSARIAEQLGTAVAQSFVDALKATAKDVPERAHKVLEAELLGFLREKIRAPGQFYDLVVPIYHEHFSHEEIRGLLAFYDSPLGKKTIAKLPAILQQGMEAGRRWGESMAPEIQGRMWEALKREKLIPADAPPPG